MVGKIVATALVRQSYVPRLSKAPFLFFFFSLACSQYFIVFFELRKYLHAYTLYVLHRLHVRGFSALSYSGTISCATPTERIKIKLADTMVVHTREHRRLRSELNHYHWSIHVNRGYEHDSTCAAVRLSSLLQAQVQPRPPRQENANKHSWSYLIQQFCRTKL